MRGVGSQNVRAQQKQANGCLRLGQARQVRFAFGDPLGESRVVEPHIRVIDWRLGGRTAPCFLSAVARDQKPDHLFDIVVRPAQPILHGQKPGAQILRLAGNILQDLWQTAQHLHLLLPRGARRRLAAAQLLQKRHRPRSGLCHIEIAHLGQADDLTIRDDPDESIDPRPRCGKFRQDGGDMLFDEQKVGDKDIRAGNGSLRTGQRHRVFGPFRRRMNRDVQPRKILEKARQNPCGGACGMLIQRHEDDVIADGGSRYAGFNVHNGPLPRKASRR